MSYKDPEQAKQASKERMRRMREEKRNKSDVTPSIDVTPKPDPVTPIVTPKRQRHYIIDPLPGQPKPRTSPIKQIVTIANVQSVAQAIAKPQQQRIAHTLGCTCYVCKPPMTHNKQAHTNKAND